MIPIERHESSPIVYEEKNKAGEKARIIFLTNQFSNNRVVHSLGIICKTE